MRITAAKDQATPQHPPARLFKLTLTALASGTIIESECYKTIRAHSDPGCATAITPTLVGGFVVGSGAGRQACPARVSYRGEEMWPKRPMAGHERPGSYPFHAT